MAASIGLLAGCSQMEQDFAGVNSRSDGDLVEKVIFEVLPIKDGDAPETRASAVPNGGSVGFVWEATDTVGIYPDKGSQVYFNIEDGVGTSSVSFTGGGWALKQNSTYVSYYPFVGDIYLKRDKIPVSFAGQKQIGTTSPFVGARYYLATEASTSEHGVLRFSYSTLNTIINVNATLPAGTYTKMSLTIEDPLFVEEGTYSLDDRVIVGTKFTNTLEIELEDVVLTEEGTIPIYIMSAPVDLKDKQVTVMIMTSDGKGFKCVKTPSKAYVAGTRYGLTCDSMVQSNVVFTNTISGYSFVDIGLRKSHIDSRITPESVYDRKIVFATCNIGADYPEDFGYYFRWGELEGWKIVANINAGYLYAGQFSYDILSATQHDKEGNALSTEWNSNTFSTSYALSGRIDLEDFKGKTNLQCNGMIYGDAATFNWGSPWVTPDADFLKSFLKFSNGEVQLSNGTKTISIGNSTYSLSLRISFVEQKGVYGLLIENEELSTSVFVPAGGRCFDSQLCFSESYNDEGNIMNSSTYDHNCGDSMFFDSSKLSLSSGGTYVARPIRPIAELTLSDEIPAPITLPGIETPEIQSIDYRSATVKSSLTSNGNALTLRGVRYGTSLSSMTTQRTSGYDTGDFSINLYGLSPGTTYYLKAYATNEAGTVESDVISFTTTATYGTLNGHEWVDIGIRKSHFDSTIEPGSSADRRIVFAIQNIGASDQYDDGFYFRGNELYGWDYSGPGASYTPITSANLLQKDNAGNVVKVWDSGEYFTWDDNTSYYYDFGINYTTGDAIQYYLGNGWREIPYELAKKLSLHTSWYSTLPTTTTTTNTKFAGLSLVYSFNSSGKMSLSISNQELGTYINLPGGKLYGRGQSYYDPGAGFDYWVEGNIQAVYDGGIKHCLSIYKDSMGDNWDPDSEDFTTWEYGWEVSGFYDGTDCYGGHHIRAVAELPL